MPSVTLTLSGNSSQLNTQYFPAIDLSDGEYVCGLVDFQTFNSIPNIDETNNLFYYGYDVEDRINSTADDSDRDENIGYDYEDNEIGANLNYESSPSTEAVERRRRRRAAPFDPFRPKQPTTCVVIPTGSYELEHLAIFLKKELHKRFVQIMLLANKNTLRCELLCSQPIDFTQPNTIGPLLGFHNDKKLIANVVHESQFPANILKVNVIRIECGIVQGSYLNNQPSHTIHEFSPRVPPGYKIVEVPQNVIYFPVTVKSIQTLGISIVDQNNRLINFRGETITVRLHIKKVK